MDKQEENVKSLRRIVERRRGEDIHHLIHYLVHRPSHCLIRHLISQLRILNQIRVLIHMIQAPLVMEEGVERGLQKRISVCIAGKGRMETEIRKEAGTSPKQSANLKGVQVTVRVMVPPIAVVKMRKVVGMRFLLVKPVPLLAWMIGHRRTTIWSNPQILSPKRKLL